MTSKHTLSRNWRIRWISSKDPKDGNAWYTQAFKFNLKGGAFH